MPYFKSLKNGWYRYLFWSY